MAKSATDMSRARPSANTTLGEAPSGAHQLGYMPALDGVRAVGVLAVMAYHAGLSFIPGGFFSLDTFFVLSGFLITTLLITEHRTTGGIALRAFWARRARRLLPALFVVVLAVVLYGRFVAAPGSYPDMRLDAISSMFYFANWHFIASNQNYFIASGPVSPLLPTWSLAIEEQFYIVWPIVLLLIFGFRRQRKDRTRSLWLLLALSLTGAAASAVEMAVLFHPGSDATRLYFGTDTHGQSLLVGAALASAVALWRQRHGEYVTSRKARRTLGVAALAGIGLYAWAWSHIQWNQDVVFLGGFTVASVAAAVILADVVLDPKGVVSRALSIAPLRYLGTISYGLYLWHYPLDIAMSEARIGFGGIPLFLVRSATTIVVASVSFYALERPIRTGTFFRQLRARIATPVAVAACLTAVLMITALPATAASVPDAPKPSPAPAYSAAAHRVAGTAVAKYSKDPVRVLMVGDSVALTLGEGLFYAEGPYHLNIYDEGIIGCGIATGQYYSDHDVVTVSGPPCTPDPSSYQCPVFAGSHSVPCQSWPDAWADWIKELHPNVVVLLAGRWEVVDRTTASGQWTNILHPQFASYVKQQLELAVNIATSGGAKMVIETAPCYDSGEQPDGAPWPEDSSTRLFAYNDLVREVAAEYPATVTVQDLDAVVCPGGKYTADLHGVPVRTADGVHFVYPPVGSGYPIPVTTEGVGSHFVPQPVTGHPTPTVVEGGEYLAPALLPLWEELGHEQQADTHGASVDRGPLPNTYFLSPQ
jgi:peptidoglycan/LPS O-acetylase OafA/YrhL